MYSGIDFCEEKCVSVLELRLTRAIVCCFQVKFGSFQQPNSRAWNTDNTESVTIQSKLQQSNPRIEYKSTLLSKYFRFPEVAQAPPRVLSSLNPGHGRRMIKLP